MIWFLIKFFSEEKHADEFIKGQLFLNRLSYFRKQEEECSDGRSDTTEAIKMWFQPHDVEMLLRIPGIGETKITSKDLARPMSFTSTEADYLHIFCMYAIYTDEPLTNVMSKEGRQNYIEKLKANFSIDDRCLKFGAFAVIVPANNFLNHLKKQLVAQNFNFRAKLVEYYDNNTFHGEISDSNVPFKKQLRFAYQKEFRIVVQPREINNDPITIDIGSIENILAQKFDSSKIIALLKNAVIE